MNPNVLEHGLTQALPLHIQAAWGCKAIWIVSGNTLRFPPNKQSSFGPRKLRDRIAQEIRDNLRPINCSFNELVHKRKIAFSSNQDVVLFDNGVITMVGNPMGSHGAVYVAVWLIREH